MIFNPCMLFSSQFNCKSIRFKQIYSEQGWKFLSITVQPTKKQNASECKKKSKINYCICQNVL